MKKCKVKDCESKNKTREYCSKHYQQFIKYGKILVRSRSTPNKIIIKKDYCEMVLYNQKCKEVARTLFDKKYLEKVKQHKWCLDNNKYVHNGKIRLHTFINGKPPQGLVTDHINRNKLDNRDENLRFCTHSENRINSGLRKDNTSGIKGVYWDKNIKKWVVVIKRINLGRFKNKQYAIKARREAEQKYYKEFTI